MKTAIRGPVFYLVFLFTVLYSCDLLSKDEVRTFIPGVYTRHYKDEFTDSYDTTIIRQTSNDTYLVTRKSKFQKINDQKLWVPGTEVKKWLGTYDQGTGTLFLLSPGKNIIFDPKNRELRIGTEPYKKLEQ